MNISILVDIFAVVAIVIQTGIIIFLCDKLDRVERYTNYNETSIKSQENYARTRFNTQGAHMQLINKKLNALATHLGGKFDTHTTQTHVTFNPIQGDSK